MFVLTKDKWDFSFAQTMQDCLGLLKVSGKNCLLVDTSDETWNMHKIKTCMLLPMLTMFLWKKEAEEVRKEMEEENRKMLLLSSMYRYSTVYLLYPWSSSKLNIHELVWISVLSASSVTDRWGVVQNGAPMAIYSFPQKDTDIRVEGIRHMETDRTKG